MDTKYLIHLKNQIESLDKIHHVKIFKILKDNKIKFSENRNGIFINMTSFNANNVSVRLCNASSVCSESMWSNNVCSNAVCVDL